MENPKDGNIAILDSLRAFAALSVCVFHFICTTTGYIKSPWVIKTFYIGQFGVQLFFVVSGFIIPWSMYKAGYVFKDWFRFMSKRLVRLEPPYLFSILLLLSILYVHHHFMGGSEVYASLNLERVMLHIGYLIPFFENHKWLNQVYWTLATEFQFYLLTALLFAPLIKARSWMRYLVYAVIVLTGYLSSHKIVFYWLPEFLLGILLFLFKSGHIKKKEFYTVTVLLIAFCLFHYKTLSIIFLVIPIIGILYFEKNKIPVLDQVGKFSYSLYLIHPVLGSTLINHLSHSYSTPAGKVFVILTGFAFTLLSSWLTYLLIERPSKRASALIKYKNPEAL